MDTAAIDIEEDSLFVMNKVFNDGTWEDIKAVLKYYGISRIKKEMIHVSYLKKAVLSFLCLITGLKESDFYVIEQHRQIRKTVWSE